MEAVSVMRRSIFAVTFCLVVWVMSCQTLELPTATPASTQVIALPTRTYTTEATIISELPTDATTATRTVTPYPTRTPGAEAERSTPTRGPRPTGLVIMTPTPIVPTPTPTPLVSNLPGQLVFLQGEKPISLWTFSLGTSQVRELLPDVSQMAVLLQNESPHLVVAASQAVEIDGINVYQVPIPEFCLPEGRCKHLQFSPDGRYLAFTAIIDPEIFCGSGGAEVQVWDVATGEMLVLVPQAGFSTWLSEDKFLYGHNGCEAGNTYLWDMEGGTSMLVGRGGNDFWSPNKRVLAGLELTFFGYHLDFWMYNIENERFFKPQQGEGGRYASLCWHPDSSRLAYTWQAFEPPDSYEFAIGPKELWIMEADGGGQIPLLLSPEYNYIITTGNNRQWECYWLEDWLQVREVPFKPISTTLEPSPDEWPTLNCPIYGTNCMNERFLGINVRTGEVKDWDTVTQEIHAVEPVGPNLANNPIFISPDNSFALYLGVDNKGLWYVPEQGDPQRLLPEGYNFVYVAHGE